MSREEAWQWVQARGGGVRVDVSWSSLKPFRLLSLHSTGEYYTEWEERNVAALRKFCREEARIYGLFSDAPELSERKWRRGAGKKWITPLERRHEWAVLRLTGWSWKRIASAHNPTAVGDKLTALADTIRKSVAATFRNAMIVVPPKRNRT